MNFINTLQLRLSYVRANGPDPDDNVAEYLIFPGSGSTPQQAYFSLKGSAANMDWPQGTASTPFVSYFPNGPNLVTDAVTGYTWGVRSWKIESACMIPGKLEIAWYLYTNSDDASPDSLESFDLDVGAWSTGDLPIYTGDYDGDYYRECLFRFTPLPLVPLL